MTPSCSSCPGPEEGGALPGEEAHTDHHPHLQGRGGIHGDDGHGDSSHGDGNHNAGNHRLLSVYSPTFIPLPLSQVHAGFHLGGAGGGGGGGGGGILDHKCPLLEFEEAKLLDMSSTSVKQ